MHTDRAVPPGLRLRSGLTCTWPAPGTVQIGLSRRSGVVVTGLTDEDVQVIDRLRGPIPAAGGSRTVAITPRARQLVRLLADAGLLAGDPALGQAGGSAGGSAAGRTADSAGLPGRLVPDAEVWSIVHACPDDGAALVGARRDRRVTVVGAGRLGGALAASLAAAGVGVVGVADPFRVTQGDLGPLTAGGDWLGRFRRDAVAQQVREAGAEVTTNQRLVLTRQDRPDLVVLIEHSAADAAAADELVSADVPHLSVVVRDTEVMIGPLVVPGAGPCLRCLDMHRSDRDAGWSRTLRQLLADRAGGNRSEESAISGLAAGLAALQVLAHLDGVATPAAIGATLEIELPQGLTARRTWPVHPRCGCTIAF